VNLAPDVQPTSLGALQWDPAARTCSLTCHGKEHNANMYNPAP
jgi:hypothetical protein